MYKGGGGGSPDMIKLNAIHTILLPVGYMRYSTNKN